MYDLEIVVPISLNKPKYAQRFEDFKKYGLLNLNNKKILLTLLVGTENVNIISWHKNIDIQIISHHANHPAAKIYGYYSQYNKELLDNIRWFAKFDDDSITDVNALVDYLDYEFDWWKEYYIAADVVPCGRTVSECALLQEVEFKYSFHKSIYHEWEGCVISNRAMKTILNNKKSMHIMKKRSLIEKEFGDICLAIAARLCKIHPVKAYFMTKNPKLKDFTLMGGHLAHIHFMARDINPKLFEQLVEKVNPLNKKLFN